MASIGQGDLSAVIREWPSPSNFLAGLAFASSGRFSDPNAFVDALAAESGLEEGDAATALDRIEGFVADWVDIATVTEGGLNQSRALRHVMARDAALALDVARETEPRWLRPESVEAAVEQLKDIAGSWGLDVDYARQRIVNEFPAPYADASFAAMTFDRGDLRLHDIEPGVVLLRDQLRPLYSIGLLAHEFTHLVIGRVDTDILARGLEEGLADFFGQLMFAGGIMPPAVCERLLLNSRSRHGRAQLGRLYRDGLLSACSAYLELGDDGFKGFLRRANREGRLVVHDLERNLAAGTLRGSAGDSGDYRSFAQRFLAMTPDLVVTPLAMLLAERLSVGQTVDDAVEELNLDREQTNAALNELQSRVFLTVVSDGRIASNEGPFYADLGHLRYDAANPAGWQQE